MSASPEAKYTVRKTGEPCTKDFRVYITVGDDIVSPWHEIPLFLSENEPQVVNMVVEIPRWSNVKMEVGHDVDVQYKSGYRSTNPRLPICIGDVTPAEAYKIDRQG
jgi:hypothetical protein